MARFTNLPPKPQPGPTNIQGVAARTFEGGAGLDPTDPHVELFNAAVSGFLADGFYEKADAQLDRIIGLVPRCDPDWLAGFAPWLRNTVNMRSASVVIAAEFARSHPGWVGGRKMISAAMERADEPGELLAYWLHRYGRPIPSRVKRGVADAVGRLYTERSLLKYDGSGKGWRFGDVIEMVHPDPITNWQSDLFRYALNRRRHPDAPTPETLGVVAGVQRAMALPVDQRRALLDAGLPEGFTWERLAGWLPGGMDGAAWGAAIPHMGLMALTRNLNNFDRSGVDPSSVERVISLLTNPVVVNKSRMMPYRFLTAYKNLEADTYKVALGEAADLALVNLPYLTGSTLIMVDCSGSMSDPVGAGKSRSPLTRSEAAGFMAEALARRCAQARITPYGTTLHPSHEPERHVSLARAGSHARYRPNGGTYTWRCTEAAYQGEDRVVIITDEQAHDDDTGAVRCPVITWNVAGYKTHHANHGLDNRYLVSGFNDSAIQILPSIIQRASGRWPWEAR